MTPCFQAGVQVDPGRGTKIAHAMPVCCGQEHRGRWRWGGKKERGGGGSGGFITIQQRPPPDQSDLVHFSLTLTALICKEVARWAGNMTAFSPVRKGTHWALPGEAKQLWGEPSVAQAFLVGSCSKFVS